MMFPWDDLPWKREKLTDMWHWPHTFWVRLLHLWFEDNLKPTQRRIQLVLRATVLTYTSLSVVSMNMASIIKVSNSGIVKNVVSVFQSASVIIYLIKMIEIVRNKKNFQISMNLLDGLTEEIEEPENVEYMKKAMFRVWFVYLFDLMISFFAASHWCLRPLLFAVIYQERTAIIETYPAPLATWTQFCLLYIAQFGLAITFAIGFAVLDNIYFCICQYVLAHIGLLRKNVRNLHLNGQLMETIKLTKIVQRHVKILRVCKELRNASGPTLAVHVIMTILLFCTGVFALTTNDQLNVNMLMNLAEILFVAMLRLYLLAWYSTEVTLTCKNLGNAAFSSDWVNGSEKQKKELLILIAKTRQPVLFGSIIPIDFDTFLMVFKSAFSYYNFLQATLHSDSEI